MRNVLNVNRQERYGLEMDKEFDVLRLWMNNRTLPSSWLLQSYTKRMSCFLDWLSGILDARYLDVCYRGVGEFEGSITTLWREDLVWLGDPFYGEEGVWQEKQGEVGHIYCVWRMGGRQHRVALCLVSDIALDGDFLAVLSAMFGQLVWGR